VSYFGKRLCYISELQSQIRALENRLTLYSAAVTKEGECFQQLVAVRNMPVAYNAWFLFFSCVICCLPCCEAVLCCFVLSCVSMCSIMLCCVVCAVVVPGNVFCTNIFFDRH